MFNIRYVIDADKAYWFMLDKHMSESEFVLKVRDKRGYVISHDDRPVGIIRYNLFWDSIPFLTLIYFEEPYRGKGFGRQSMLYWEEEMREFGYKMVMIGGRDLNTRASAPPYRRISLSSSVGIEPLCLLLLP